MEGEKRAHLGDPGRSPRLGAENGTVRKCLALLGILREAGTGARIALTSTPGDWIFGRNEFGSPRGTLYEQAFGETRRRHFLLDVNPKRSFGFASGHRR